MDYIVHGVPKSWKRLSDFQFHFQMSTGFNLKSPATLAPNKKVSLSVEALKAGIDFSSLAMKVIDGIFY